MLDTPSTFLRRLSASAGTGHAGSSTPDGGPATTTTTPGLPLPPPPRPASPGTTTTVTALAVTMDQDPAGAVPTPTTTTSPTLQQRDEEQVHQDVRALMARLQNILPFLMLFALRYVYRHALGLAFAVAFTLLVVKLNKQFCAQVALKDDQDPKVLWAVVGTSLVGVVTACLLRAHVSGPTGGDGEEGGGGESSVFWLIRLPPDAPELEDVLWAIFATDVCVRLCVLVVKALVALAPPSPWRALRLPSPLHWVASSAYFNGGGGKSGNASSPHRRQRSSLEAVGLLRLASSLGSSTSSHLDASGRPSESRGERHVYSPSLHTRKRRVYYLLEAVSVLVRSLLPVGAWMQFYSADKLYGDVWVFFYLTLKCMVLSRHCKGVASILASLCQTNTLEYGMPASKEAMQEAGATDCVVCYEALDWDRSAVLPCAHVFCESCLSEWCERERSCPLCRSPVSANFDDAGQVRSGSTSAWPCIL